MDNPGVSAGLPNELKKLARIPGPRRDGRTLLAGMLDLLFPPRCAGCGAIGQSFCEACLGAVRPVPMPVCLRCGTPQRDGSRCPRCRATDFSVDAIRAAGIYRHPLSTAIRRFKYEGQTALHRSLAGLMADYWQQRAVTTDVVIAVPLHADRLRERGYNQSQLLAEELCRRTGLPLLPSGLLMRSRATRQQVLLNVNDRQQNVAGAFAWQGPSLAGVKVLLIDDVATSGATLEACGHALRGAAAGKVWALTVARAASVVGTAR